MDPNETLAYIEQRVAILLDGDTNSHEETTDAAMELAEAVRDLDGWMTRGGFAPKAWTR